MTSHPVILARTFDTKGGGKLDFSDYSQLHAFLALVQVLFLFYLITESQ